IFRKPLLKGMKVSDCLREFQTGGIRRYPNNLPFEDVIESERTPRRERDIVSHPSLKPQSLLRRLVYVILPLGEGMIADPFMGSGSTIAAAEAVGTRAVGIERHRDYFDAASKAISRLKALHVPGIDQLLNVKHDQKELFARV
ncbi:MAG: site-specific DNA-methyltransferase, partial [Planctomycetes bacterium]|nr:site-specific DNA-methyltransferase [Planctomycetota bacterium]